MQDIFSTLKPIFKGDIDYTENTLQKYSHDASLFEIRPQAVVFPRDSEDVKTLVRWVNDNKKIDPTLSITARAAGTDMSGGSIGRSIVMDTTRYMNEIIELAENHAIAQPGCFYRDFDKATKKINRYMPAFTASREINAVGGMVGNNSGGEKAIKFGKTENYINSLKCIMSDGNEYEFRPMTKIELEDKIALEDHQSKVYKRIYDLIIENYDEIMAAKPDVSKNSAGYYLWNVYDKNTGMFDICRLIVGSQGTLCLVTEINFKIIPIEPYENVMAIFLPSLEKIGSLDDEILPFKPDSLEAFDDKSMFLAVKFFFDFFKQMGFVDALKLGLHFIPEAWMTATGGIPKMILLVEFNGETPDKVEEKLNEVKEKIKHFGYKVHIAESGAEAEKYWRIRHESFNLLRKHVKGKRTAPFIDDIVVKPEYVAEFIPKIKALIDEYGLEYTVQGHLGNGNFHIIPLMDLDSPYSSDVILDLSKKVYDLVKEYKGSITAEHNDGIIRTPYLLQQFGQNIIDIFIETKNIFDPQNIFNPGKKVGGTFDDIRKSLKKNN